MIMAASRPMNTAKSSATRRLGRPQVRLTRTCPAARSADRDLDMHAGEVVALEVAVDDVRPWREIESQVMGSSEGRRFNRALPVELRRVLLDLDTGRIDRQLVGWQVRTVDVELVG